MPNILGYRLSHLTSAPITLGQKIGLHPVRYGEANCTRISPPFIYGPDIQSTSTAAPHSYHVLGDVTPRPRPIDLVRRAGNRHQL